MIGPCVEIFNDEQLVLLVVGFMKDYIDNGNKESFLTAREIIGNLECRGNFNLKSKYNFEG